MSYVYDVLSNFMNNLLTTKLDDLMSGHISRSHSITLEYI